MSQHGGQRGRGRGRGNYRPTPYNRDGNFAGRKRNFAGRGGKVDSTLSPVPPATTLGLGAEMKGSDMPLASRDSGIPPNSHHQGDHEPEATGPGAGGASGGVKEKKYSVKARLFVGNLPKDTRPEQVREMFQEFGELKEVFVQKEKNFGFVRMAYRSEAEMAVAALNGKVINGRDIKVRLAASNSSIKVSNLNPVVSNELLGEAFAQFGDVEKAVVVTDDRGKSLGYGIVDFSRKAFAVNALRRCNEDHFILTKSPTPVMVTEYIKDNDEEGQPEKSIPKNTTYRVEREAPPRFSQPNSLEFAVATQWKMAYDSEKRQRDELEQHLRQARSNLVREMENIKEQHQTELIRQELAHHQQEQLRLVRQLQKREGTHLPGGGGGGTVMEGNASGAPPSQPHFPGQHNDKPQEALLANPPFPRGGGGGVFPPGGVPPTLPLFPPPLMGQKF